VEFRCPCDGVGALDSGAGDNIVKWCVGGRRVGQESRVEIPHAQSTEELIGGLGSVGVLMIHYSFL
jgi:hypothetical protein